MGEKCTVAKKTIYFGLDYILYTKTIYNGNIGRKYVDLLTHELKLFSTTADSN